MTLIHRGRRLRRTPELRNMVRETHITADQCIMPYFVVDAAEPDFRRPIVSMPGQYQFAPEALIRHLEPVVDKGLNAVMLFGIPAAKNPEGTGAWIEDGIVQRTLQKLRQRWPHLVLITDVCLCEYTSHGHCGLLDAKGEVLNDATLPLLARTAVSHAQAGAHMVAPSDMMDGRIRAIRQGLDAAGFESLPVMAYAVKYASAYYGPFREAAESAPRFGNRRAYQMDPGNAREALREAQADLDEGADMLIVKPGGPYQDILRQLDDRFSVPLAAYQVSGEYALIRAAGRQNWIDEKAVILESLVGLRRAGARLLISYFTEELLLDGTL